MTALWIPNNNCFVGRAGLRPRWIINHGTAGGYSAVATANYFASTQNTANPVSATYIVDQLGTVVQCNAESDGAWGNGFLSAGHDPWWADAVNPNNVTISIEHVKSSKDNSDTLTPAQQAASFKLQNDICDRWKIPKRLADANGGITGHYSIDPVNRQNCPGPYPWDALWAYLGGNKVTQADYDALYKKLTALEGEYDAVVTTKNKYIDLSNQQKAEIALLQQQLTTLQPAATKAAITSAIATLQKLVG